MNRKGYSMNKEDPYRDQAEKLRQKIERTKFEEGEVIDREELPPRSRVHEQKRKKSKWKLKYPVIHILMLFFILLPITILSIYASLTKDGIGNVEKTGGESSEGFEIIDIEDSDQSDIPDKEDDESVESLINETENKNETSLQENLNQSSQDIIDSIGEKSGPKDIIYHTVQPGETIYRISIKYYKSKAGIDTIKSINNLTSNEIRVGQVLTISLNK
jgi:LysM repeat protein